MNLPKLNISGNTNVAAALISAIAVVTIGSFVLSDKLQTQKDDLQATYQAMEMVNLESLESEKKRYAAQNDMLSAEVQNMKADTVTQFDKDVFSTAITTFADLHAMSITKMQQSPMKLQDDGFYNVSYDISLTGSIYGMMEFMNLIETMGYQTNIEYFSFRQNGTYEWLLRSTDKEDLLQWIQEANEVKDDDKLEEMKALALKIETDNYDYGDNLVTEIVKPAETKPKDPMDNFISSLLQIGDNVAGTTTKEDTKVEVITPAEREAIREKAVSEKIADKETLANYLKENYPEGTMIKNGQLIIPTLDGSMVFDLGITFIGNVEGAKISDEYLSLLLPSSVDTSEKKRISVVWDGKKIKVPSVIEGVDVSALDGINISDSSKFTVSWNNNQLSKDVVEQCLELKEDGGKTELNRAAAEIRFLQKNGKTDLEIMKYLIFLYQYIYG